MSEKTGSEMTQVRSSSSFEYFHKIPKVCSFPQAVDPSKKATAVSGSAGTLQMPALNRPFRLGMLYDCRTDQLVPGITLWDQQDLDKDVNKQKQESAQFKVSTSDTLEDKANVLDIKASLKLSFLGGLINVSGSAKYLDDRKSSSRQERVTLKYECTTSCETLSMAHLGKGNIKHTDVFDKGDATHVVTGIMYGANAFFVFDRTVSESDSNRNVDGELHAMVKKIPCIEIDGNAALKLTEKEKMEANSFSCTFYGDFKPSINPTTFQDAVRLYKKPTQRTGREQ
jgi:hypothetical protein